MAKFPKRVRISVTAEDIESSNCGDPTDCMIHHAVKRTIGGHGYVKVDGRGVFITRRSDYREHAVLPKIAYQNMRKFDRNKKSVSPFDFYLDFNKTTKIHKYSREQIEKREVTRRKLRKDGKLKKYDPSERYVGIAFSNQRAA
jgi:hypothetical protein